VQALRQASNTLQKEDAAAAAAALVNIPTDPTGKTAAAATADDTQHTGSSTHMFPHSPPPMRSIPLPVVLLWRLPLCVGAVGLASLIMRTARRVSGSGKGSGGGRLSKALSHGRLGAGRLR
jgi:hypothetical protein